MAEDRDELAFLRFLGSDEGLTGVDMLIRDGFLTTLKEGRAIHFAGTDHVIVSPEGPVLSIDQVSSEARRSLPFIPGAGGKEQG